MARIRSLKPEFWADEDLADLPRDARLLYMGLWNLSDEHSRLRGDARYVKGQLFPYDADLDAESIDKLIQLLIEAGKVRRYDSSGRSYLFLPNLSKHNRLEPHKVDSKLPAPPELSQPAIRTDESARGTDESASDAEDHALLLSSSSLMEHVSSSAREPGPAERFVLDAIDDADVADALAVVDLIQRERKPKAMLAYLRGIAANGELGQVVTRARGEIAKRDAARLLAAARDGPMCEHDVPGGALPHPVSGQPICPICRRLA